MQIICSHCQRQLNLPDDKVPDRPFALTCPSCQERIQVDPTQPRQAPQPPPQALPEAARNPALAGPEAPAAVVPATVAPAAAAPAAVVPAAVVPAAVVPAVAAPAAMPPDGGEVRFEALLAMRDLDKQLLRSLYPLAAVVTLGRAAPSSYEAGLRHLGMEEVHHFTDLAAAGEEMLETDFSILTVLLNRATAPPCEPLQPFYDLPQSLRRDTFVTLVAENVRSLDGQTAFYLQVNCLIATQDLVKFPVHLQRALLFHLRLYRFWGIRDE